MKSAADATYRWSVASRAIAAAAGGYALVSLLELALAALFPAPGSHGLLFSAQTAYLCYTGIIIWCFATRTARRAWLGLLVVAAPLALIAAWYLTHRSAP